MVVVWSSGESALFRCLLRGMPLSVPRIISPLTMVQSLFSIYYRYLAWGVSERVSNTTCTSEETRAAIVRLLRAGIATPSEDNLDNRVSGSPAEPVPQLEYDDPRAIDFRHYMRTWVGRVPWSSIRILEMQKWIYWALFNAELTSTDIIPQYQRDALDEAMDLLQRRCGCKLKEGSNPEHVVFRLTIESTNVHWRPLTFYAVICSINWGLRQLYQSIWNIQHGRSKNGLE